jgi:chromate transporter
VRPQVSRSALFLGFLRVALSGFGGVMPWARRMIVEDKRWMTEREFLDVLALCQLLPGPNIVNVAIAVGARFQGVAGALVAFTGLMSGPITLIVALGLLYGGYGHLAPVRGALGGISAVAAGLVIAMALRMGGTLHGRPVALAIAVLAFVGAGLLRVPLGWVVLALAPLSVVLAAVTRGVARPAAAPPPP